jgi:hypothetical protein
MSTFRVDKRLLSTLANNFRYDPRTVAQFAFLLALGCASLSLEAQQQDAVVTFKFYWSAFHPSQYSVTIHHNGLAEYVSDDRGLTPPQERNNPVESNAERAVQAEDAASQDVFHKQFTASDSLRQKVFALAEKTHFFDGQFDYTAHPIAQTGSKTLNYQDGSRHTSTTYNYSEDPSIQELTEIFQGISTSIEGGRKLQFDLRFDKLGLDKDLENLEQLSKDGHLQEVQVISPILQRLATDRTVLHIAQKRAENILRRAGQPLSPTAVE